MAPSKTAAPSVLVKETVPEKPVSTPPPGASAVTVKLNEVPAVAVVGAETARVSVGVGVGVGDVVPTSEPTIRLTIGVPNPVS